MGVNVQPAVGQVWRAVRQIAWEESCYKPGTLHVILRQSGDDIWLMAPVGEDQRPREDGGKAYVINTETIPAHLSYEGTKIPHQVERGDLAFEEAP